jgi:hypothetical protein
MDFDLRHILPLMIPIVAIIMGVGVAMLSIWTDYRRKSEMFELHHKERLLAIERGMEVPSLPAEFFKGSSDKFVASPNDRLRHGLIWLLVGVALTMALVLNSSLESAAWGLLPVAVGLANLIYYATVARNQPSNPTQQDGR